MTFLDKLRLQLGFVAFLLNLPICLVIIIQVLYKALTLLDLSRGQTFDLLDRSLEHAFARSLARGLGVVLLGRTLIITHLQRPLPCTRRPKADLLHRP